MDTQTFAMGYLEKLMDFLEKRDVDTEWDGASLTFVSPVHPGTYLLTYHGVQEQLWLSSPLSGAHHFRFMPETQIWHHTRTDVPLETLLQQEIFQA